MEYCDKNSLGLLRALSKKFAEKYKTIPLTFVVCYRDIVNASPSSKVSNHYFTSKEFKVFRGYD
jgi:hypothetical protein